MTTRINKTTKVMSRCFWSRDTT